MNAVKDRLLTLIEEEGLNPNQFYLKSNLGNGYIDKIGNVLRKPSREKLEKAFPNWNIEWLLHGTGEKYKYPIKNVITGNSNVTGVVGGHNLNMALPENVRTKIINEKEVEITCEPMSSENAQQYISVLESENETLKEKVALQDKLIKLLEDKVSSLEGK